MYGTVENERYVFSCQYVDGTINLASLGQMALSFAKSTFFDIWENQFERK
jgi:hypothetical protein